MLVNRSDVPPEHHVSFIRSNQSQLTYIQNFSPEQGKIILTNYYTFVFVREPWERLLSAWTHKFSGVQRKYAYPTCGGEEGKAFLEKFSPEEAQQHATFPEVLEFLTTRKDRLAYIDKHFRPIHLVSLL